MRRWKQGIVVAMLVAAGAGVWGRVDAQTVRSPCPTTYTFPGSVEGGTLQSTWNDGVDWYGEYISFNPLQTFVIRCEPV